MKHYYKKFNVFCNYGMPSGPAHLSSISQCFFQEFSNVAEALIIHKM